jgi:hypothetical protein
MPGRLERIVFYEASASISVKKKTKGNRSTKRYTTKGRGGTDNISLRKEIIGMIEAKELAVSAALDLLAASEILSCFESQEKADLDRIRACIEINELPSFALVQSICPGKLLFLLISWLCSCRGEYFASQQRRDHPCCKTADSSSSALCTTESTERTSRLLGPPWLHWLLARKSESPCHAWA